MSRKIIIEKEHDTYNEKIETKTNKQLFLRWYVFSDLWMIDLKN